MVTACSLVLGAVAGCSGEDEPSAAGAAGSPASSSPGVAGGNPGVVSRGGEGGGSGTVVAGGEGGVDAEGTPTAGVSGDPEARSFIFDNTTSIGGLTPTVLGAPTVSNTGYGSVVCFDGVDDALIFAESPIEGLAQFTLEALLLPAEDGPAGQRFLHLEETGTENRVMMETRVAGSSFYVDTFLRSGEAEATLVEPSLTHPTAECNWVALSYAEGTGRHFTNGLEEVSAEIAVEPLGPGRMGVGVRLNLQYWFQGCIRELRVTSRALPPDELQSVASP
jgi:hypothetical protein